jgi:hypothetical protein
MMDIRFVPFEEIDKNKWNGTVHFARNGNVCGYYWYLRSVIKEWDALIEGDYQSVMPLPRYEWPSFALDLLTGIGLYSVNPLSENRILAFYNLWEKNSHHLSFSFNEFMVPALVSKKYHSFISTQICFIDLNQSYKSIYENYHPETKKILSAIVMPDYEISGQEKPEIILKNIRMSSENKNIYYRLFYNAIQRNAGIYTKVYNLYSKKYASAFFVSHTNNLNRTFAYSNDEQSEIILIDTILKTYSGKDGKIILGKDLRLAEKFGAENVMILQNQSSFTGIYIKLKGMLKMLFEVQDSK